MRTIPKTKRYVEPTFEKSYGSKHRLERATPGGDFYVVAWPIQVDVQILDGPFLTVGRLDIVVPIHTAGIGPNETTYLRP